MEHLEAKPPGFKPCWEVFDLCNLRRLHLSSLAQFSYLQNEDNNRTDLTTLLQGFSELICMFETMPSL